MVWVLSVRAAPFPMTESATPCRKFLRCVHPANAPTKPSNQECTKKITTITLLRLIPTMTFQNNHVRFCVSLIMSGEGRRTTHLLKCVRLLSTSRTDWRQSSDILSDISFDILSDILSDISPHMIAVEVRHGTLNSQDRGWGPARNTELTRSRLRSGTEHWTPRIAVGDEADEEAKEEKEKKEEQHLT